MANECMNYISIQGNKELITLFKDSYLKKIDEDDYELDFNIISPIPENCKNDYEFRIAHWGNKWDGTNAYITFCDDEISIDVSTAWAPCVPIVRKLISLCPGLYFHHEYYEPGCGFAGYLEHQNDDDPDEYEETEYSSNDPLDYWQFVFDREFETLEWLYDLIEDEYDCEEITEEDKSFLLNSLDNDETPIIVEKFVERGVLR